VCCISRAHEKATQAARFSDQVRASQAAVLLQQAFQRREGRERAKMRNGVHSACRCLPRAFAAAYRPSCTSVCRKAMREPGGMPEKMRDMPNQNAQRCYAFAPPCTSAMLPCAAQMVGEGRVCATSQR